MAQLPVPRSWQACSDRDVDQLLGGNRLAALVDAFRIRHDRLLDVREGLLARGHLAHASLKKGHLNDQDPVLQRLDRSRDYTPGLVPRLACQKASTCTPFAGCAVVEVVPEARETHPPDPGKPRVATGHPDTGLSCDESKGLREILGESFQRRRPVCTPPLGCGTDLGAGSAGDRNRGGQGHSYERI